MSRTEATDTSQRRWPRSVFVGGSEPDPRFTFANQRTLLAWIRTALAFVLAAAVIDAVPLGISSTLRLTATLLLGLLGSLAAIYGWRSWAAAERAMRLGHPLPTGGLPSGILVVGVIAATALVVAIAAAGST